MKLVNILCLLIINSLFSALHLNSASKGPKEQEITRSLQAQLEQSTKKEHEQRLRPLKNALDKCIKKLEELEALASQATEDGDLAALRRIATDAYYSVRKAESNIATAFKKFKGYGISVDASSINTQFREIKKIESKIHQLKEDAEKNVIGGHALITPIEESTKVPSSSEAMYTKRATAPAFTTSTTDSDE